MRLTRARHWFSAPALVILLPTAMGAAFSLASIQTTIPSNQFRIVCFVTLAGLCIIWSVAAWQDFKSVRAQATVDDLLARMAPAKAPLPTPLALQDLQQLSADDLRLQVSKLAPKMRAMEAMFHRARSEILFGERGDWNQHTTQMINQSAEQTHRWHNDLQPEAVALWNEMRRRIYGAPPYPTDPRAEVALDHGMLAGVSPLNDAAKALERLARDLPG